MSEISLVAAMDQSKKNSKVTVPAEEESTVMIDTASNTCFWNDQEFKDGAQVCDRGTVCECSFGKWVKTDQGC